MGAHVGSDRLTAGTFFVLLQEALKPRTKARDTLAGSSDGLNGPEMLAGLIRIVRPGFTKPAAGNTFGQQTSELRNCHSDGDTTYLPVGSDDFARETADLVTTSLPVALERTRTFIDRFVDVDHKGQLLVQMLGAVVARDETIDDNWQLVPREDGAWHTKAELLACEQVCLEALVLGLWAYVSRPDVHNTEGRSTFERWHREPAASNAQWKFDPAAFILDTSWSPVVTRWDYESGLEESDKSAHDEEIIDAEIVENNTAGQEQDHDGQSDATSQTSRSWTPQVVFNQYGPNSQQIGSVGTLNIGRSPS